jgi:ABC-type phosphate transport system substrate-binding protein
MDKLFFIYLISELLNCICHDLNVTGSYELKSTLEKLFFNYYYEKRHNINYDGSASSGKCNMIGLWHKDNSYDTNVISYSRVQQDTKLCSNLSNYVDHYNPIVDYALLDSYSTISSPDRKDFPDIVNIPTVVGAIVPIVNLKLNRDQKAYLSPLKLAKSTLVQIFFGEISYWNDRSILKDNANTSSYDILNGVDAKIQLILPEEYDGHVDLFLKALSSFNSSRISYDRLLVNDNVIKVSDSRKVIEEVLNTPYSISWCSLSEALFNGVEMISLLNSDGYAVRANHESLSYALFERIDEIKINPESNDNSLINGQNKLSWPISQYYYNSFRLSSHVGNCQRRQDAVASVLQFYDSRHTDWIESNGDIITLPDFTASQFKTYIINKANCSDGSRAVVSITDENFHVLTSDSIRPIVETWLNVYYSASKTESKVNIISSNDSIILDRHFESNPDFYYGLFTIRKDEEMNKLTSNGQTDPYLILIQTVGFIPIVPIYNIPSFMSVFNQTVSLVVGPQLLVDIFSGSIRYWDDNRIKDMNSHAAPLLPHEKIHLIFREKNSDSQSLFFRYLGLKTSDPYFDNPNPEDRFEAADFQYAYDDKDMDLKVSRTPYAMGFFVMTYSPTSPVVSFCTAGHCDDSKDVTSVLIDLSNHNQVVNAVSSCLFDFNTIKNPNSDVLTYDLMLSSAPSCYPITATIDWITFRGESDSCSQSSQTCTSSYSICEFNQTNLVDERVKFSAWIFSESTMNKLFYSQLSPVVPTPMDARINSFVAACDVTCQEAPLGFTYCGYYECSSSRGDYERVISDCDPKWITRDIHYRVIEGISHSVVIVVIHVNFLNHL